MPLSPLPDPLYIFSSPKVVAVLSLIDPLRLRRSLTRLTTLRLATVTLALAVIRAWNKMLSAMAALPARRRSHGDGKAAILAGPLIQCPAYSKKQKSRRRRTFVWKGRKENVPKKILSAAPHPENPISNRQNQTNFRSVPTTCLGIGSGPARSAINPLHFWLNWNARKG